MNDDLFARNQFAVRAEIASVEGVTTLSDLGEAFTAWHEESAEWAAVTWEASAEAVRDTP